MKKVKEFFGKLFDADHKKVTLGVICGLVAVIVVTCLVMVGINVFGNKDKKVEKQLTTRLEELGKDFYENFYYEQTGSDAAAKKEFLSKYTTLGIKVNVENLARYKSDKTEEIIAEFKNAKGEACDTSNTKVVIYPKEAYGKTDYTLDVILECGFDKKEEKK